MTSQGLISPRRNVLYGKARTWVSVSLLPCGLQGTASVVLSWSLTVAAAQFSVNPEYLFCIHGRSPATADTWLVSDLLQGHSVWLSSFCNPAPHCSHLQPCLFHSSSALPYSFTKQGCGAEARTVSTCLRHCSSYKILNIFSSVKG